MEDSNTWAVPWKLVVIVAGSMLRPEPVQLGHGVAQRIRRASG